MIAFKVITLSILVYLFIGYLWTCYIYYKCGAGFEMPGWDRLFIHPHDNSCMHKYFWLIPVFIYVWHKVHTAISTPKIFKSITPTAFYERGIRDNDVDMQAEKHLLGGSDDL